MSIKEGKYYNHDHQRNRPPRKRFQRRGIQIPERRLRQRGEAGTDQKSNRRDRIPPIRPGAHPADETRLPDWGGGSEDQFREYQPDHGGHRKRAFGKRLPDAPCQHGQQCEKGDRIPPFI